MTRLVHPPSTPTNSPSAEITLRAGHLFHFVRIRGNVSREVDVLWLMIEVHDLFEVHLTVRDLDVAIGFYGDIVGLTLAHVTRGREAAFLWIGSGRNAMLGLWAAGAAPQTVTLHTAFRVSLPDVLEAPRLLLHAGVTPLDFDGRPTDLPVVLAWMPAAAVYFRDPDGHLLEYIAMLPHEPRTDCGIVPWHAWELMQSARMERPSTRAQSRLT